MPGSSSSASSLTSSIGGLTCLLLVDDGIDQALEEGILPLLTSRCTRGVEIDLHAALESSEALCLRSRICSCDSGS